MEMDVFDCVCVCLCVFLCVWMYMQVHQCMPHNWVHHSFCTLIHTP